MKRWVWMVLFLVGCASVHEVKSTRLNIRVDSTCVLYSTSGRYLTVRGEQCQDIHVGDSIPSLGWRTP